VGTETGDDAAVYRLSDDEALVATADFITPVADDPRRYGRIAAANALSDVYAMGGRPLVALALCLFPKELTREAAHEILAGGADAAREAGAALCGGHTVRAPELFYGLSVTGRVHPQRIWRNVGARPGDALLLTKPLGTGLVINGLRKGVLSLADALPILDEMARLNRVAAEVLGALGGDVHAATDVTGFGLSGHALKMAEGSGVALRLEAARLPRYPGVEALVAAGVTTAATRANRAEAGGRVVVDGGDALAAHPLWDQLLHDPQTSGGLLVAVAAASAERALAALADSGIGAACQIGEALPGEPALVLRLPA
jgi:selenide,water dikinase